MTQQYEYRVFLAASCRPSLSHVAWRDLCNFLHVMEEDAAHYKVNGLTLPQIDRMKANQQPEYVMAEEH